MSGLYVTCGSFEGDDKSASALDEVLDALADLPTEVRSAIEPVFDDCYASVPVDVVALLLPHVQAYRTDLVARLGHDDTARADREAREAGETRLRGGAGWALHCANDVIRACETAAAEREPVVFIYF